MNTRLHDKMFNRWSKHGVIQSTTGKKNGIAQSFSIKPAPVHAPQQSVVCILGKCDWVMLDCLPESTTGNNEPMKIFKRSASIDKVCSQPIEKFRMGRNATHFSEIVWSINDAFAKMVMPDAINNNAPSKHICRISEPIRKSNPALAFII